MKTLTFQKDTEIGHRTNVFVGGVKVGWVQRSYVDRKWMGFALVGPDALEAKWVSQAESTRKNTVWEILFQVRKNGNAVRVIRGNDFKALHAFSTDTIDKAFEELV